MEEMGETRLAATVSFCLNWVATDLSAGCYRYVAHVLRGPVGLRISLLKIGVVYTVSLQLLLAYHDLVEETVDLIHPSVCSRLRTKGNLSCV